MLSIQSLPSLRVNIHTGNKCKQLVHIVGWVSLLVHSGYI